MRKITKSSKSVTNKFALCRIGERVLLTLWVGGLWTIGLVVAPVLFASLDDRALAGTLAGSLFEIIAWAGLACGLMLLIANQLCYATKRLNWRLLVLLAMLILVAAGQFVIAPMVAELRAADATGSSAFARLHGLAALLYLMNCLLGLVLVVASGAQLRNT